MTATGRKRLVAILCATLVLGACGDDGNDGGDGATPTAPGPTTTTVSLYLGNEGLGDVCTEVFPVQREVPAEDPLEAALQALLAGPTDAEAADGYTSWFSDETADLLEGVDVQDGRALVSFDPTLPQVIPNASTSCGSASLLGQLDRTVTQFPEVTEVVYALAGDPDPFYEWLQRSAPE